jgi:hypothetical protein
MAIHVDVGMADNCAGQAARLAACACASSSVTGAPLRAARRLPRVGWASARKKHLESIVEPHFSVRDLKGAA